MLSKFQEEKLWLQRDHKESLYKKKGELKAKIISEQWLLHNKYRLNFLEEKLCVLNENHQDDVLKLMKQKEVMKSEVKS